MFDEIARTDDAGCVPACDIMRVDAAMAWIVVLDTVARSTLRRSGARAPYALINAAPIRKQPIVNGATERLMPMDTAASGEADVMRVEAVNTVAQQPARTQMSRLRPFPICSVVGLNVLIDGTTSKRVLHSPGLKKNS